LKWMIAGSGSVITDVIRLSFRKDVYMKLTLSIIGMLALSFFAVAQQELGPIVPASSPNAEIWRSHAKKMDREELLSKGVPERYHYLYSFNVERDEKAIRKALPFTKIALSRSRCLGFCPVYDVEFADNGVASYNGIDHTKISGVHIASVSLYELGRISWAIERLKLTEPQPKPNGAIYDTSVTKLTITLNSGKTVEVTDHGFPTQIELLLVATLIDRIADSKKWE